MLHDRHASWFILKCTYLITNFIFCHILCWTCKFTCTHLWLMRASLPDFSNEFIKFCCIPVVAWHLKMWLNWLVVMLFLVHDNQNRLLMCLFRRVLEWLVKPAWLVSFKETVLVSCQVWGFIFWEISWNFSNFCIRTFRYNLLLFSVFNRWRLFTECVQHTWQIKKLLQTRRRKPQSFQSASGFHTGTFTELLEVKDVTLFTYTIFTLSVSVHKKG